jgi:hypothetical protein
MGLHVNVDYEKRRTDVWVCLSSGCMRYEEGENFVEASIEDKRKDGLRTEKSVVLKRRENYAKIIRDIINENIPAVGNEPRADEGELFEIYKFVAEKYRKGYRYIGVKTEFTTPRGIRVYFRVRFHDRSDGPRIIVELTAEKDGERLTYQAFGQASKTTALLEEVTKAIGMHVLFSEYVFRQTPQQEN